MPVDKVTGIVTRTDVLRTLHGVAVEEGVGERRCLREADFREADFGTAGSAA